VSQYWNGDIWFNNSRKLYSHDDNENILSIEYQEHSCCNWYPVYRNTFTFDNFGNLLTDKHETRQNGVWNNDSLNSYTYCGKGNRQNYTLEVWINEVWVNTEKYSYEYDENDNLISDLYETFENMKWVNHTLISYTYDKNQMQLWLTKTWQNNEWIFYNRYNCSYDENGNIISELFDYWSDEEWKKNLKLTYAYNDDNNLTLYNSELWSNGKWITYDNNFEFEDPYDNHFGMFDAHRIVISYDGTIPNVQNTYVPDDDFEQALIDLGYDSGALNDSVPTANIDTVTVLNIASIKTHDLTGIEDFVDLEVLICALNLLTSLNVNNNTSLQELNCKNNKLSILDVSDNPALEILYCNDNKITRLDLSNNSALKELWCFDNYLISLDPSNNPALEILHCLENGITSIDVSKNSALEVFNCAKNNLTDLDLSYNTALKFLRCDSNNLTSLNIKNGNNKNIDVFAIGNPDLFCIQVDDSSYSANAANWMKDDHAVYSEDCTKVSVEEFLTDDTEVLVSPNPFSQSTMINYQLAEPGQVVLKVYDALGIEVAIPVNEFQDAGEHNAVFDGSGLAAGMFYYIIQIGGSVKSGKLLLIK
jgi:hypothetical protein